MNVVRESIHSVFLHHACLDAGMDMGIVNSHEMLAIKDLKPYLLKASLDLVFNVNPEATEMMLECTEYERQCMAAKKAKKPMPKLPKSLVAKKERKVAFDWVKDVPKAALEPPFPV